MNLKVSSFSLFFLISFFSYSQIIPTHRDYQWEYFGLQDTSTSNFNNVDLSNYGFNSLGTIPNDTVLLCYNTPPQQLISQQQCQSHRYTNHFFLHSLIYLFAFLIFVADMDSISAPKCSCVIV